MTLPTIRTPKCVRWLHKQIVSFSLDSASTWQPIEFQPPLPSVEIKWGRNHTFQQTHVTISFNRFLTLPCANADMLSQIEWVNIKSNQERSKWQISFFLQTVTPGECPSNGLLGRNNVWRSIIKLGSFLVKERWIRPTMWITCLDTPQFYPTIRLF